MNEIPKIPEKTLEQRIEDLNRELADLLERRTAATDKAARKALAIMISGKLQERAGYQMKQLAKQGDKKDGKPGDESH